MELGELITPRPVPDAGLLLSLTRCSLLAGAHRSTSFATADKQTGTDRLRRLVASFTARDAHGSASLDAHDEQLRSFMAELKRTEVPPAARFEVLRGACVGMFAVVRRILDAGVPASFCLTGTGLDDPHRADVVAAVRGEFADRMPMLVNDVRPAGRAESWADSAARQDTAGGAAVPCPMAARRTVAFDGTVVSCRDQQTVDEPPVLAHLLLGYVAEDDGETVRHRQLTAKTVAFVRRHGSTVCADLVSLAADGDCP